MKVNYIKLMYSVITPLPFLAYPFGYIMYLINLILLYFTKFTEAALLVLFTTPLLAYYTEAGAVVRDPLGFMLYGLIIYIPVIIIILSKVKIDVNAGVSNPSTPLLTLAFTASVINPILGFGYAAASSIIARREAFSTPWYAPTAISLLNILNFILTGSSMPTPAPLRLYATSPNEAIVMHFNIPPLLIILTAAAYAAPFTYYLIISLLNDERLKLLALPVAALNPVALVAYPGLMMLNDADSISSLYGSIAELPTVDQLKQYYMENWMQLIGLEAAKSELTTAAESFRGNGVRPIHGILLYGPAGTGKTALGLGYAAWLGLHRGFRVIIVKAGRLMRGGSWEAAWRLERVFALARALQPSVIYIDEVDSIGRAREESGTGGYRLVSVLLQNIDGVASRYDKVLVVATTNNVNALDEALIRPGRLGDLKIYVAKPPPEMVKAIIIGVAQQRGVAVPDWLLEKASSLIETGAEAEALVNCIAIKQLAGVNDAVQFEACLAGITRGIEAYS